MNKLSILIFLLSGVTAMAQQDQPKQVDIDLITRFKNNQLTIVNREVNIGKEKGNEYLEFLLNVDEGLAWIEGIDFKTGTIEIDLKGQDVFQHSFLGIAFHGINDTSFEAIYFRPFQFRTEDTIRQKRAVQYISLPDHTWSKLRETNAGKFEHTVTPAPDPNDWFHARFVITEQEARVYVNNQSSPCMTVPLLGAKSGKIGLYTADRSGGSFANLRIIQDNRSSIRPIANIAPRHLEEIAWDTHRKKLILAGGGATDLNGTMTFPDQVLEWNNKKWVENQNPGPKNRYGHALVYHQAEKVTYLLGGILQAERKPALDVWKYDGNRWTKIESNCPAKTGEATFDPTGKRILFYGDVTNKTALRQDNDPLNFELWELKNESWKKLSDEGPSISSQFEMAYDSRRNALIIPTWENGSPVVWEWKDEKWNKIRTGQGPSVRNRFALAYDESQRITLLFGGRNNNSLYLDDFWKWDGLKWTEIICAGKPPARAAATMEYGTGGTYLYGGVVEWGLSNEIWKWHSDHWKLINASQAFTEKRAYEEYEKRLMVNPNDTDILLQLGQLKFRGKKYTEAFRLVNKAYALKPDDHNLLLLLSSILSAQNRDTEIEGLINEAVSMGKLSRNSYTWLANQYYTAKSYKWAILCFQASIVLQPDGGSYYNLACCQALLKDINPAFISLNRAVDFGFADKGQYQGDTNLDILKSDERWKIILEKLDAPFNGRIPYKRAHHELMYNEADQSVLLFGGSTPMGGGQYKFFNDMWRFDHNGWNKIGNKGDERSGMRLAFNTQNNKIYSYGGYTATNKSNGQLRVFENGDWKILTDLPEQKSSEGGFVYDSGRDHFIAFGGSSSRGVVNGITWEWDGSTWQKFNGESPAARQGFVMVYDIQRKRTILYGGMDGNGKIFDDGIWEYDGLQWNNIKNPLMPPPRMMPGYAYDSKRGLLMVYGGADSKGNLEDTWSWNGIVWKKLADQGPSPRVMGSMAYDKHRDRLVLFGGRLGVSGDADDTWEWDGKQWLEMEGSR